MTMEPLFLITNDDGHASPGLHLLAQVAQEFGEVVVMAPEHNASGVAASITCSRPLRVRVIDESPRCRRFACDGTPADCVKMGLEHFCHRKPDLVLSGINYGSNASINIIYSGTMGAVLEACLNGCQAIGFSLLNHNPAADFEACAPSIRHLLRQVLEHPLPEWTALNVNIPRLPADQIKGIKVCRQARAVWNDSLEPRTDPHGRPYWWMTGKFICNDMGADTDQKALEDGFVSVVPVRPDMTDHPAIAQLQHLTLSK